MKIVFNTGNILKPTTVLGIALKKSEIDTHNYFLALDSEIFLSLKLQT